MGGKKGYILVEGHGEVGAAHNLITRLSVEAGLHLPWTTPRRWKNLHQWKARRAGGIQAGAEWCRTKADAGMLLILRDEDDACPKALAPEVAAWDCVARSAGLPLRDLAGGCYHNKILCYNTNVGWLGYTRDELVDNVRKAVDSGFRGVKVKIGSPDFGDDIERLESVRKAVGDEIAIATDVNNRWDLQTALQCAPILADYDIAWLEEPLYPFDVQGHAELATAIETPLLHGENIYDPLMFRDMLDAGAMGIAQPSDMKLSGISRWLDVASLAESAGRRVVPAGWTMMQIDQHLASATPNCWMIEWIPWIRDIFQEPVHFEDGYIIVSESPGAGTAIKPEFLEKYNREK